MFNSNLNINQAYSNNNNSFISRLNTESKTCTNYEFITNNNNNNNNNNVNMNSNKPKLTFYFGRCKVCKDKATGIHYGIATCECCKVFFKRGIQNHQQYRCFLNYKCEITPKLRKKCRYCRWQACLKAGMSYDAIKMGRIPRIEKEKSYVNAFQNVETNDSPNFGHSLSPLSENSVCLSEQTFLSLQRDKCYQIYMKYNEEFRHLYEKANKLILKGFGKNLINQSIHIPHKCALELVMSKLEKDIRYSILYAKDLPGFERLPSSDFQQVAHEKVFMLLFLRLAKMFINDDFFYYISDNIVFCKTLMRNLFGEIWAYDICTFFTKFNSLSLTDYELAAYMPFILTIPKYNEESFENLDYLIELNEHYSKIFAYEMSLNNRKNDFILKIEEVYALLPRLNEITRNLNFKSD